MRSYEIIRHGMMEEQALEVKSALIDFIGLSGLTNAVAGVDADTRGRMTVQRWREEYKASVIHRGRYRDDLGGINWSTALDYENKWGNPPQ